ncbi:MAG: hypothetical protein QY320_00175 [Gammaproteobacteria bacterium]|nr:MAG: hypothetical protein QY320_00175 [Gammaproteobacteria bacterium]
MDKAASNPTTPARYDAAALQAAIVLAACLVALVMYAAWERLPGGGLWPGRAGRGWLLALAALPFIGIVLGAFDVARRKNVAWRALRARFAAPLDPAPDRSNYGAGKALLSGHTYWGTRSFGSSAGLGIARVLSLLHRPLYIPWSEVSAVDAYPNVLTGNPGFETDMGAILTLRGERSGTLEVPWLAEFRSLMPKSVRFRLVKLPEKK